MIAQKCKMTVKRIWILVPGFLDSLHYSILWLCPVSSLCLCTPVKSLYFSMQTWFSSPTSRTDYLFWLFGCVSSECLNNNSCVAGLLSFNQVTEETHKELHPPLSSYWARARHARFESWWWLLGRIKKRKGKPTLVPIRAGLLFTSLPTWGVSYGKYRSRCDCPAVLVISTTPVLLERSF